MRTCYGVVIGGLVLGASAGCATGPVNDRVSGAETIETPTPVVSARFARRARRFPKPPFPVDVGEPSPPIDPAICAAEPDLSSCVGCCVEGNLPGALADEEAFNAASALYESCICAPASPPANAKPSCQVVCAASLCAGKDADDACLACLESEGRCNDAAADAYDGACLANPDCAALRTCAEGCPSDPKPPER